jgi:hypothetical protein
MEINMKINKILAITLCIGTSFNSFGFENSNEKTIREKAEEKSIFVSINNNKNETVDRYKDINIDKENLFFRDLFYNENSNKEDVIKKFKNAIETYNPMAMYSLASYYKLNGNTEEAAKYAVMGKIRAQFDYNRAVDKKTKNAIQFLDDNYAKFLIDYIMEDVYKFEDIFNRVIDRDSKMPYNYDPKWINMFSENKNNPNYNTIFLIDKSVWRALYNLSISESRVYFVNIMESAKNLEKIKAQKINALKIKEKNKAIELNKIKTSIEN